jgi:hypothetical protein
VLAADFSINVCGAVAGEDPARLAESVKQFPTATVEKPALLPDSMPGGRSALAKVLHVDPTALVHRVVFKPQSGNPIVVAFVTPDLKDCQMLLFGRSKAAERVSERIRKADSGWSEINVGMTGQLAWQRKNSRGTVVTFTTISGNGKSTILGATTGIDELPTIAEFDSLSDEVVGKCVRAVLSASKPTPTPFLTMFGADPPAADGSVRLTSKKDVPGGRLLLIPRDYGTACLFGVERTTFAFDFYQRAFSESFLRMPGAVREGEPSLTWVFKDPISKKTALMDMQVDDKRDMFVVTIELEQ